MSTTSPIPTLAAAAEAFHAQTRTREEERVRVAASTLGGRVRTRRRELGLTREELCARAEISMSTLSRVEANHRRPFRAALVAIAHVLDCERSDLEPPAN